MTTIDGRLAGAGLGSLQRHAWIEVDLAVLADNARALKQMAPSSILGAVVKADGYGHGLEASARAAVTGGAGYLVVATLSEGLRLRADGYHGPVLVLYPLSAEQAAVAAVHHLEVVAGDPADVAVLDSLGAGLNVHLEVDTGMGRGGVPADEAAEVAAVVDASDSLTLVGVWSHLFDPDSPAATRRQQERFHQVTAGIAAEALRHLDASGGLMTGAEPGDLIRPGLVFYGHPPLADGQLPLGVAPALTLKARPVHFASLKPGDSVGYGGDWVASRPSRVATLPLGYADGWSRSTAAGGMAVTEGTAVPIVGRISSDALTVDVTDMETVTHESEFILLGSQWPVTAEAVATVRDTISWEVLQQLSSRLTRVYTAGGDVVGRRRESSVEVEWTPSARFGYPTSTEFLEEET